MIRTHFLAIFPTILLACLSPLAAQDSGPLIDKLVQKGILNDQEAEELRADLVRDNNQTSAGKLNISSSVTELKITGNIRYRWQYDDTQKQIADPGHVAQRSRNRFRLKLHADLKLGDHFFGGVGLETGQSNDSTNQTVNPGFSDSNVYLARYFLGWQPNEAVTLVAGKQKNPFYNTSELMFGSEINPMGLSESIAFHEWFTPEAPSSPTGNGKSSAPPETAASPWQLTLIGGQFIFSTDNDESQADGDAANDAWFFDQQLVAKWSWNKKTSVTVAPYFLFYNAADISGLTGDSNLVYFSDAAAVPQGATDGVIRPISGETRNLAIVGLPGEFQFPLGKKLSARLIWDVAWNTAGEERYSESYSLGYTVPGTTSGGAPDYVTRPGADGRPVTYIDPATGRPVQKQVDPVNTAVVYNAWNPATGRPSSYEPRAHDSRDDVAWLLGIEVSTGKGRGSWTWSATYREVGITSVDPNLNDGCFALSRLNIKGWRISAAYALTDFLTATATAELASDLDPGILGGQATGGSKLADSNAINIFQLDLTWKF